MLEIEKINFNKLHGLIPACIQDHDTLQVLMVGFMNQQALEQTLVTGKVTFWSRSKNRLWVKGETSGNFLSVVDCHIDCDNDSLLIYAKPHGPTCHLGTASCFQTQDVPTLSTLIKLTHIIEDRYQHPKAGSYTTQLLQSSTKRIAQKVGEEGVEVALAALAETNYELANEAADLLFHLFVLLKHKNLDFKTVAHILENRAQKKAHYSS